MRLLQSVSSESARVQRKARVLPVVPLIVTGETVMPMYAHPGRMTTPSVPSKDTRCGRVST